MELVKKQPKSVFYLFMASVIHLCWLLFGLSNQLLNCVIWIIYDYSLTHPTRSLSSFLPFFTHSKSARFHSNAFLVFSLASDLCLCEYHSPISFPTRYYCCSQCRWVSAGVSSVVCIWRWSKRILFYFSPFISHAFEFFRSLFNSNRVVWGNMNEKTHRVNVSLRCQKQPYKFINKRKNKFKGWNFFFNFLYIRMHSLKSFISSLFWVTYGQNSNFFFKI